MDGRCGKSAPRQRNILPVIVLDDTRLDVFARKIRDRVDVGEEADGGQVFQPRRGGQFAVHHAGVGQIHVLQADLPKLPLQQAGEVELRSVVGDVGTVSSDIVLILQ